MASCARDKSLLNLRVAPTCPASHAAIRHQALEGALLERPLVAEPSLLAAGQWPASACQRPAAKTHGPPSPKLRAANPRRFSRRPTILVFPRWWAAPAHTTKSQFRRVCEETPNFATSIPRSPSLTKQHLCPVVDIAARQDGCWQVRRTHRESIFARIAPPRALVGRVWVGLAMADTRPAGTRDCPRARRASRRRPRTPSPARIGTASR